MKAIPVILIYGEGFKQVEPEKAEYVIIHIPGPSGRFHLPVILHGTREGTNCWSWNGDTEKPTLRPSILRTGRSFPPDDADPSIEANWKPFHCHTWVNDGCAIFLDDCDHELRGQTVDLLDVAI